MSFFEGWLNLSIAVRLIVVWCLGLVLGAVITWAHTQLSWTGPSITPWSGVVSPVRKRTPLRYVPVVGWLLLYRSSSLKGSWWGLRAAFVEMLVAFGIAALYWWECDQFGLFEVRALAGGRHPAELVAHLQWVTHVVLFLFLGVATLIDLDEKTIPDEITLPGTLVGIWWAAICPGAFLRDYFYWQEGRLVDQPLWARSDLLDSTWNGSVGLLLAAAILLVWGWGLLDKTCTLRRGWLRGLIYALVSAYRYGTWKIIVPVVGLAGAAVVWGWWQGGWSRAAVLSSVIGLGFGGGVIWAVRILARWALRVEAMGFGDVTLMAMIGSFLGWQPSLLVFFVAPFAALIIAVAQYVLTRSHEIAFGPYLSLATVVVLVRWQTMWSVGGREYFRLPGMLLGLLAAGLLIMALSLWCWRQLRSWLFGLESS